jgi:hypothetical protein
MNRGIPEWSLQTSKGPPPKEDLEKLANGVAHATGSSVFDAPLLVESPFRGESLSRFVASMIS